MLSIYRLWLSSGPSWHRLASVHYESADFTAYIVIWTVSVNYGMLQTILIMMNNLHFVFQLYFLCDLD